MVARGKPHFMSNPAFSYNLSNAILHNAYRDRDNTASATRHTKKKEICAEKEGEKREVIDKSG